MELIGLAALWVIGTGINIAIANAKGRDFIWTLLLSIFLSPLLAYLYILAVPSQKTEGLLDAQNRHLESIATSLSAPAEAASRDSSVSAEVMRRRSHKDFL